MNIYDSIHRLPRSTQPTVVDNAVTHVWQEAL